MASVEAIDPRTEASIGSHPEADLAAVETAVVSAADAAANPALADVRRRAAALRAIAEQLSQRVAVITALASAETGLPLTRLESELERTALQLIAFADFIESGEHLGVIIDLADPQARPIPRPDVRRILTPIGPVAVFGAGNFPLAFSTVGGDTAAALAAGCPVVVKGHPGHPGTGELVAAIADEAVRTAGLPDGAFAHILAADHGIAGALVEHPAIAAVAFTGSARGGRALMDRAAARPAPIPVYAEMGSVNPVILTVGAATANEPELAHSLADAVARFAGQVCTKPGIIAVPTGEVGDRFEQVFARRLDESAPVPMLSRVIRDAFLGSIHELQTLSGARQLTQPRKTSTDRGLSQAPDAFSVSARTLLGTPRLHEELFGPGVIIVRYECLDEVAGMLRALGGQLTATIHSTPEEQAGLDDVVKICSRLAGRVLFVGPPTGVSVTWAMQHGGPWPASSVPSATSVGLTAIERFQRPVAYQDAPDALLPPALRDANPIGLLRRVDGTLTREPIGESRSVAGTVG